MIANGIEARVVRDTVTENDAPVEITDDWYVQDKAGNVWYLGEYVTNYKNGKVVDHGGSFEAGIDGAQPGIAMPANPDLGLSYRQEYYKGEAEDKAAVITIGEERVQVPFGYFDKSVLMSRDLVPTEPKVQEAYVSERWSGWTAPPVHSKWSSRHARRVARPRPARRRRLGLFLDDSTGIPGTSYQKCTFLTRQSYGVMSASECRFWRSPRMSVRSTVPMPRRQ